LYALYAALGALDLWPKADKEHPADIIHAIAISIEGVQERWFSLRGVGRIQNIRRRWAPPVLVGSLMAILLVALYVMHPVPYALRPYEEAVLGYLRAHTPDGCTSGGDTVILLVDTRLITWYVEGTGRPSTCGYRQWRFHDVPFLLATDGQFDLTGDAACLYGELARAGVSYVYSSPQRKTRPHFWQEVAGHPEFFEPVLEAYGAQLWRVRRG
jgi:hypothetical protein